MLRHRRHSPAGPEIVAMMRAQKRGTPADLFGSSAATGEALFVKNHAPARPDVA
jgi:hypothetical protein